MNSTNKIPVITGFVTGRNYVEVSFDNDDMVVLVSYGKPVAAIINRNNPVLRTLRTHCSIDEMGVSKTTRKHIKEFFNVYGFRDLIPVETTEKELYELMAGK